MIYMLLPILIKEQLPVYDPAILDDQKLAAGAGSSHIWSNVLCKADHKKHIGKLHTLEN